MQTGQLVMLFWRNLAVSNHLGRQVRLSRHPIKLATESDVMMKHFMSVTTGVRRWG